jgi:hypothetical protein
VAWSQVLRVAEEPLVVEARMRGGRAEAASIGERATFQGPWPAELPPSSML